MRAQGAAALAALEAPICARTSDEVLSGTTHVDSIEPVMSDDAPAAFGAAAAPPAAVPDAAPVASVLALCEAAETAGDVAVVSGSSAPGAASLDSADVAIVGSSAGIDACVDSTAAPAPSAAVPASVREEPAVPPAALATDTPSNETASVPLMQTEPSARGSAGHDDSGDAKGRAPSDGRAGGSGSNGGGGSSSSSDGDGDGERGGLKRSIDGASTAAPITGDIPLAVAMIGSRAAAERDAGLRILVDIVEAIRGGEEDADTVSGGAKAVSEYRNAMAVAGGIRPIVRALRATYSSPYETECHLCTTFLIRVLAAASDTKCRILAAAGCITPLIALLASPSADVRKHAARCTVSVANLRLVS